uniref:Uncharacterized protein n=1 Tax=Ciona intestinalis TaxID=7719 RepID=F6XA29_CIOIN
MNKSALLLLLVVGLLVLTDTTVAFVGRRRSWYWNQKLANAEDTNEMDIHPYYEVMQELNGAEQ